MANIKIDRIWMEHSGGTKYYQIFELHPGKGSSGRVITVTHWGAMDSSIDRFPRPINGGQTQIKEGALANATRSAKVKRGYLATDTKREEAYQDDEWFTETFGATLAHDIKVAMFEGIPVPADEDPIPAPDTSIVPKRAEPKPESWGSW